MNVLDKFTFSTVACLLAGITVVGLAIYIYVCLRINNKRPPLPSPPLPRLVDAAAARQAIDEVLAANPPAQYPAERHLTTHAELDALAQTIIDTPLERGQ